MPAKVAKDASPQGPGSASKRAKSSFYNPFLEDHADVILCFDDEEVPSHSQLLRMWSNVLCEVIAAEYGDRKDGKSLRIPMTGSSSSDWIEVAAFLYPVSEPAQVTWSNLEAVLVVGDKYDMPHIMSRGVKFLDAHMHELNTTEGHEKYIWKWLYLMDKTAELPECSVRNCLLRLKGFNHTCTMARVQQLSRGTVDLLVAAFAGTMN